MKKCSKCYVYKSKEEFYKYSKNLDGLKYECSKCEREYSIVRSKTKDGLITKIYSKQRSSSRSRKHYMPTYSNEELKKWILEQHNFQTLWDNWVASGYLKDLIPSVDRKNDYKPYTLNNIKLMTWRENNNKCNMDMKNGINNKISKSIEKYDIITGIFIEYYYSISKAARQNNLSVSNISRACRGIYKSSGGFGWRYSLNKKHGI